MAQCILDKTAYKQQKDVAQRLLHLHCLHPARYPHLLMSNTRGGDARYSILFAYPQHHLTLSYDGSITGGHHPNASFLEEFERQWRISQQHKEEADKTLPFHGGWFFFLSYEFAQHLEPHLALDMAHKNFPCAQAVRMPAAIIHDNVSGIIHAVSDDPAILADIKNDWHQSSSNQELFSFAKSLISFDDLKEEVHSRHLDGVRRCIEYIHAGDVFQVNLSRVWRASISSRISHAELFLRLALCNPSPFAALATWGNHAVISSSPERLISIHRDIIETRPIAGTRPRGTSAMTDIALQQELKSHPKERAEHIMLVDLERNDLSRVCIAGSVAVREFMTIESYAHVHHIVSSVRGRLTKEASPQDALRAVFPGGTITGCPKLRCMEILSELEQSPRIAYTGTLGYLNHDGSMDCNILIRTMMREDSRVTFRAGGGIVADSNPQFELQETRAKAQGMVRALCGDVVQQRSMNR